MTEITTADQVEAIKGLVWNQVSGAGRSLTIDSKSIDLIRSSVSKAGSLGALNTYIDNLSDTEKKELTAAISAVVKNLDELNSSGSGTRAYRDIYRNDQRLAAVHAKFLDTNLIPPSGPRQGSGGPVGGSGAPGTAGQSLSVTEAMNLYASIQRETIASLAQFKATRSAPEDKLSALTAGIETYARAMVSQGDAQKRAAMEANLHAINLKIGTADMQGLAAISTGDAALDSLIKNFAAATTAAPMAPAGGATGGYAGNGSPRQPYTAPDLNDFNLMSSTTQATFQQIANIVAARTQAQGGQLDETTNNAILALNNISAQLQSMDPNDENARELSRNLKSEWSMVMSALKDIDDVHQDREQSTIKLFKSLIDLNAKMEKQKIDLQVQSANGAARVANSNRNIARANLAEATDLERMGYIPQIEQAKAGRDLQGYYTSAFKAADQRTMTVAGDMRRIRNDISTGMGIPRGGPIRMNNRSMMDNPGQALLGYGVNFYSGVMLDQLAKDRYNEYQNIADQRLMQLMPRPRRG